MSSTDHVTQSEHAQSPPLEASLRVVSTTERQPPPKPPTVLRQALGWLLRFVVLELRPLLTILVLATVLVLIVETLRLGDHQLVIRWIAAQSTSFAFSVLLVATILGGVVGALGRVHAGLLAGAAFILTFGVVGHTKRLLLGRDLYPWDLLLHREVGALVPVVWSKTDATAVAVLLGLGGLSFWLAATPSRRRVSLLLRGILLATPVFLFQAAMPRPSVLLAPFGVVNMEWDQNLNYKANGLILAFGLNIGTLSVDKPSGYSAESVAEALASVEPPPMAAPARLRPNIIAIMSESFFDPTTLPGVSFSEDPLPTLHRLQKEHISGTLMPPVFGGGTSNTEFEFLTGHAIRFLPIGALPYQQYLQRPHPSLASHLRELGYFTRAVHPFHPWFWERKTVYPNMGFHDFISRDDMLDAKLDGAYISDAEVTSQILRALEEKDPEQPLFLFAVTMEGHGPYEADRYPLEEISISSDHLSEAQRRELQSFVIGTHHADRALGQLIEALQARDEPSMVIFFGDHLPLLLPIFERLGAISSSQQPSFEDRKFLHQVPLVVWTNFQQSPLDLGVLSPSFVAPHVLDLAGLPGTPYTDFLRDIHEAIRVYTPGFVGDAEGRLHQASPDALQAPLERWRLLQYDLLFGERFISASETSGADTAVR